MMRTIGIFFVVGAILSGCGGTDESSFDQQSAAVTPPALRTIHVSSLSQLTSAISHALPGDHILVANGTYTTTSPISVTDVAGTASAPIVIAAEFTGKAIIAGAGGFALRRAHDVIIRGFNFRHRSSLGVGLDMNNCEYVRIARNDFQLNDDGLKAYWIYIHGSGPSSHNQIDHNFFHDKSTEGPFIVIYGPPSVMSQYDKIDHNYFARHTYAARVSGEAVRLGDSGRQLASAYMTVEQNLFEHCDGDPEVISNKSSDNIIRSNTLRDNNGMLVLRHGKRALVQGNFIFGNRSGIRVLGDDHKIIDNYISGTTANGGTAIYVQSGDVRDVGVGGVSPGWQGYDAPDRVVIAFNTLVDNALGIVIGSSNAYAPKGITVSNNIVRGSGTLVNVVKAESLSAIGNILWGSGIISGFGTSAYRGAKIDPKLGTAADGLLRPISGSPAIDTAANPSSFTFVKTDMDGQTRSGLLDVGADELSSQAITLRPLVAADVGPAGP